MTYSKFLLYLIAGIVAMCTLLSIATQPMLWPLAIATVMFIIIELIAYQFPFFWYITSHPYKRKKH